MSVNVNRGLTDQFYRYKMPKILAKVEGKGNGIKTVVVNMAEVAKALNRPPMYPTKYFGCILGAQVNYDNKNDRYIVNGSHEAAKLQDLLDGFIQKYVLCANCKNPETVLAVQVKKNTITTTCKACGHAGFIGTQDKLATYILKNPPNKPATADSGPSIQPKAEKKKDKKKKKEEKNGETIGSDENGEERDEDQDDGDWCEDTDADAVARRMEELSLGAKGLMHNNDLEKSASERLQIFLDFVNKKKDAHPEGFDAGVQKEIVAESERLDVKEKAALALCEALFNQNILIQLKQHRMLLIRFLNEDVKAQKYFLRGIELTIKCFQNDLLVKVPHVMKALYDLDIVEEKAFFDWDTKGNKKIVGKELAEDIRSRAAPFLKWLREAEEEDSSSDSDEDDDEAAVVDFNDRVHDGKILSQAPVAKKEVRAADDIDIDAI